MSEEELLVTPAPWVDVISAEVDGVVDDGDVVDEGEEVVEESLEDCMIVSTSTLTLRVVARKCNKMMPMEEQC